MKVPIEAINSPAIWQESGSSATLRIEAIKGFTTSDGQFVQPSRNGSDQIYLEVPITINNGEMLIAGFEIDSTMDAYPWDSPTTGDVPGYKASIISAGGKQIPYINQFRVPTLQDGDPSLTWNEIRIFNRAFHSRYTGLDRLISVTQVQEWIQAAVGALNRGSDTNTGGVAVSVAPLDPTFPIAVGKNDPVWNSLLNGDFPLPNSGVIPGTYSQPIIQVDAAGRVINASNGPAGLKRVGLTGAESLLTIANSPRTTDGDIEVSINSETINSPTSGANLATVEAELNTLKNALLAQGLVQYAIDLATLPGVLLGWRIDNQGFVDNVAQSTVADSSGLGNAGVQATGTKQPIAKTGIQNNKTVLRFDGTDDFLAFTTLLTNIRTIYIVYKHSTPKDNDTFLGHATSFDFTGGGGSQLLNPSSVPAVVLNASVLVNGYQDTAVNLMRPATEFQIITIVTTGNVSADSIFNDRRTALRYIAGDLAELWLFSSAHNSTQIGQAVSALKSRWALTNTNPLRRRVVFDGDSITSVAAAPSAFTVRVINCLAGNCASPAPITNGLWFGDVYALTGQTIVQMQSDASTQIDSTFNGHRIKEVLLAFGGTNDLYFGASAATLQANYQAYCEARRAAGFKVVACTILPRSNAGTPAGFETARQSFNTWLRGSFSAFADALADFAANSTMGDAGDETNTTYYSDLVHPTDAGDDILAPIAAAAINTI